MARAKKIIRKSEREALKERRRSGEFKQDKKDARAAGLSRGDARKRAKRLSRVQALSKRKGMRADMADNKRRYIERVKQESNVKRDEARAKGQKLAGEGKSKPIYSMADVAPGGVPTRKIKSGDKVSKERGMYKIVGADGYVRYSQSEPEIIKTRKNKAMYGSKVKAVKKAKNGGKITDPPKKFKTLAEKNLKEDVDTMGFKMKGFGSPKDAESAKMIAKSDNIKSNKVTVKGKEKGYGPDNDFSRKQSVEKFNEGYKKNIKKTVKEVKKASKGGKVVKRGMEQRPAKPFLTRKEIEDRRNEETKAKRLIKK